MRLMNKNVFMGCSFYTEKCKFRTPVIDKVPVIFHWIRGISGIRYSSFNLDIIRKIYQQAETMPGADILLPVIVAFLAAAMTLMTGFGLGTILTPVFLIFYDVKIAILIVAVVHLINNLAKFSLFRRHVDWEIIRRFGVLTLLGAFIGSFLQGKIDSSEIKILLGITLIFLGIKEASGFGEKRSSDC